MTLSLSEHLLQISKCKGAPFGGLYIQTLSPIIAFGEFLFTAELTEHIRELFYCRFIIKPSKIYRENMVVGAVKVFGLTEVPCSDKLGWLPYDMLSVRLGLLNRQKGDVFRF
jgi:hypothetical protein